jgi:hypothetical protein
MTHNRNLHIVKKSRRECEFRMKKFITSVCRSPNQISQIRAAGGAFV